MQQRNFPPHKLLLVLRARCYGAMDCQQLLHCLGRNRSGCSGFQPRLKRIDAAEVMIQLLHETVCLCFRLYGRRGEQLLAQQNDRFKFRGQCAHAIS